MLGTGIWGSFGPPVPWADARGIPTTAYTHHWGYFESPCPPEDPSCPMLTYGDAVARLAADAALSGSLTEAQLRARDAAQATLVSAAQDPNGRLRFERWDRLADGTSWHRWFEQPDPDLGGSGTGWLDYVEHWQVEPAFAEVTAQGGVLDGIHSDSTSGMRNWGAIEDYSRDHWAVSNQPLSFSYDTGLVTELVFLQMHEHLAAFAARMHAAGQYLTADFNAHEGTPGGYFGGDTLDFFGVEAGLPERAVPALGITVDSFAMQKRVLAYQKPVSMFDARIFDGSLSETAVRQRLEQALFYGFYVGPYRWDRHPERMASRRAIYAAYTPLLKALSRAGWEPITEATSSNSGIWIERFGAVADGDLHLTLRNEGGTDRSTVVAIPVTTRSPSQVQRVTVRELLGNTSLPVSLDASHQVASVGISLPARSTRVLKVSVVFDRTVPTTTAPRESLVAATRLTSTADVAIRWSGSDGGGTGIASYDLQERVDDGTFHAVALPSPTATKVVRDLVPGHTYTYRARAHDRVGNVGAWATGPSWRLTLTQESGTILTYEGTWKAATVSDASGGATKYTTTLGASVSFTFTGRGFALVAPTGPGRGNLSIRVDGVLVRTVDLDAAAVSRKLVHAASWTTAASRTVEIRHAGAAGERVDLDAVLLIR
jgi:hypothetical protein